MASLTDRTMKRKFEKIILGIILISLTNCESKTQNANNNSDKIIANKKA